MGITMNNLADRIAKHLDSYAMGVINEYSLAVEADFEIHGWLKEQSEEAIKKSLVSNALLCDEDINTATDLLVWFQKTTKKGGNKNEEI